MASTESARLVKAESFRGLGTGANFNFADLQERCEAYLESVRREARRVIAAAHAEADAIRGQHGAPAELHSGNPLDALKQTFADLEVERERWLGHWQIAAVRVSVAIAERILHSELARRPELTAQIVRGALELAAGTPRIVLRLHPDDAARLQQDCLNALEKLGAAESATIVPDESITQGGCIAELPQGTIDARLETQLARIAAELSAQWNAPG